MKTDMTHNGTNPTRKAPVEKSPLLLAAESLLKIVLAQNNLLAAYRTGRRPAERALDALRDSEAVIAKATQEVALAGMSLAFVAKSAEIEAVTPGLAKWGHRDPNDPLIAEIASVTAQRDKLRHFIEVLAGEDTRDCEHDNDAKRYLADFDEAVTP